MVITEHDLCKKQMLYKYCHISGPKMSPDMMQNAFHMKLDNQQKWDTFQGLLTGCGEPRGEGHLRGRIPQQQNNSWDEETINKNARRAEG